MPDAFPHGFWLAAAWLLVAEFTPLPRPCDLLRRRSRWVQGAAAISMGAAFRYHLSKGNQ